MRANIHKHIYLAGLCIIAFFLPLSEFITNAAVLLIITNFLLEGDYKNKIKLFTKTKTLLAFLLLFAVHLIWLINTQNISFALTNIRIKLPLLALPIVIATSKSPSSKQINNISLIFIAGVLISTLSGLISYYGIIFKPDTTNVRNLSVFVSHIRLSLMICLSVLILFYFISRNLLKKTILIIIAICVIIWFVAFLIIIQGFTGLSALILVGLAAFGFRIKHEQNHIRRRVMLAILILFPLSLITYVGLQIKRFYTPEKPRTEILQYTANGNICYTDTTALLLENGDYIYRNICEKELQSSWSMRSKMNLSGNDLSGQSLLHTLIIFNL